MKNKLSLAAVLSMLAVFCSGAVLGALGHRLYATNSVTAMPAVRQESPDEWRKKFTAEMQTRLQLQPEQMSKLNSILDDTREQFRTARSEGKERMKQIQNAHVERVKEMLTENQRAEYAKILAEREKKKKEREEKRP